MSDGYKAVPINTPILIELKNYEDWRDKLNNKTLYWSELLKEKDFQNIESFLKNIDSNLTQIEELKTLLEQKPLLISLNIVGKSTIQPTYILETDELTSESSIHDILEEHFGENVNIKKKEYQDTYIHTLYFKDKSPQISYAFYKGLWLCSPSIIQIEASIRQIDQEQSIMDNEAFKRVHKTAGANVDANVFIQYKTFYELFSQFINPNLHAAFKNIKYLADWSELDLDFEEELLFMNGFTYSKEESNNYLNIIKDQSPDDIRIPEISPSGTSMILAFHLSDFEDFQEGLISYHSRRNKGNAYLTWFKEFEKKYEFDIQEAIEDIIENEVGIVYTNINPLDLEQKTYFVMETKGERRTIDELQPLMENWSRFKETDISGFIEPHQVKDGKTVNIYRFPVSDMPEKWLGKVFAHAKSKYFTFIDDYMIFAKTSSDLKSIIDDNERQSTLENNSDFIKLNENFSNESNIFFYKHTARSQKLDKALFSNKVYSKISKNIKSLKKVQSIVFQINNSDDLFYTNCLLQFNPNLENKPHTIWESKLDTTVSIKPKVVLNHRNNRKEIFVQDLRNNIYLIDRNGKVLWKQNIGEKIESEVYQVDYYKNNKLQYLFNTKHKIYLIDRNGNAVERYPLTLRSEASAGIAVFDYDKSRDYRLCIPCENKKIYMYNIEGDVLPGWEFQGTESFVRSEVQHFRVGINDYILCSDKNRIYILNRRGEERISLDKSVNKSLYNPFFLTYKDNIPYFAATTPEGAVLMINEQGTVFVKEGIEMPENHHSVLINLNENPLIDVVYTDETELKILYDFEKQFTYDFDTPISRAIPFEFSANNIKIGVCDYENRNIHLFNGNGKTYKGFPLKGFSPFSISLFNNGSGRFNLITGSKNGFLYTYEVP